MPETLHVAIVDDHPLFREGVAHTLAAQPDIEIVGEGESAADAIRIAAERIPDVMLLDVSMPGSGLSAVREIAATFPVIKLVMLTVSEDEDDVTAALRAGARAYVLKGVAARDLVRIMRAVASHREDRQAPHDEHLAEAPGAQPRRGGAAGPCQRAPGTLMISDGRAAP